MSPFGTAVLLAVLALTALAAWWLRARNGAVRTPVPEDDEGGPRTVLEGLGVRPGEAELTVVQFSTAFCAPCRATRARLEQLRTAQQGLAVVHVDAESHLDEVRALDVRRTPTLFYLDRTGRLLGRSSGAPRAEELTALVQAHTGALS